MFIYKMNDASKNEHQIAYFSILYIHIMKLVVSIKSFIWNLLNNCIWKKYNVIGKS